MTDASVNDPCECGQTTIRGCADMPSRHCGATEQHEADIDKLIAEMRAGLEGVPSGDWHFGKDSEAGLGKGYFIAANRFVRAHLVGPPHEQPAIAAHIARCKRTNIAALLDEIERLRVTLRLAEPLIDEGWRALPGEFTTIKGMADEIKRLRAEIASLTAERDQARDELTTLSCSAGYALSEQRKCIDELRADKSRLREAVAYCIETLAMTEHPARKDPTHGVAVEQLGERIGYGALMSSASASWRESAKRKGFPTGGEFVAGPCFATVVEALRRAREATEASNG